MDGGGAAVVLGGGAGGLRTGQCLAGSPHGTSGACMGFMYGGTKEGWAGAYLHL